MGAWGYKIKQDDLVCDVINSFKQKLKETSCFELATKEIIKSYSVEIEDQDDGPLFWLGLAAAQWDYGECHGSIYEQVKAIVEKEIGLDLWKEGDVKTLQARKKELAGFLKIISSENPKPKKFPKLTKRKPKYNKGDCLSVELENGKYAAAIVLKADHSDIEYGTNLIGVINYLSVDKPAPDDFLSKNWLVVTHHNWNGKINIAWYGAQGHRNYSKKITVIGSIEISKDDPNESWSHSSWGNLGQQAYLQHKWDEENA